MYAIYGGGKKERKEWTYITRPISLHQKKTCSKPFTVLPPDSFVLLFLLGSVWITLDSRIQLSNISDLSQFLQSRRAMHYIILKSKQI